MATTNLQSQPGTGVFRELATIFQASQMHEGALELSTDTTERDLWAVLRRAEKLETEGVQDVPSLGVVKGVLEQMYSRQSKLLQPSLRILADASREGKWRGPLGQSGVVEYCLGVLVSAQPPSAIRIQCLRLIGNSCADTDENRDRVVSSPDFSALIRSLKNPEIVSVAVPALYNVCCDCDPASKEAAKIGMIEMLIRIIEAGILEDSPAFSYLCRLLDLGLESLDTTKSPSSAVELLLRSATQPGMETDDSISLVDTAIAHLQQEGFQRHMVDDDLIGVPLRFIVRSYFPRATLSSQGIPSLDSNAAPAREANSEAELSRVRKSLIQTLSDVSALPEFSQKHSSFETPLVVSLIAWITAALPHIQLCACIILGNLARDDHICTTIVAQTTIHKDLISVLGTSSDAQVLHSSLSFLRNLALPAQNKEILGQCGLVDALTKFWTSDFMPQVTHTAAAVARQLVIGKMSNVERFMSPLSNDPDSPANARSHISLLLSLFARTDEMGVKMEVARIVAAILRCIHSMSSEDTTAKRNLLHKLYSRHNAIGKPLGTMVVQTQYSAIRSEGWFAMALMAREAEGAALISLVVSEPDVYSALEEVIGNRDERESPSTSATLLTDIETAVPGENPVQQDDMKAKDRENALILVNGLLQQQQSNAVLSSIRRSALEELLHTGMRV